MVKSQIPQVFLPEFLYQQLFVYFSVVTEEAVTNCGIEAIEIVDEKYDGEIKIEQKRPGTPAIKRARRREEEDEEREAEKNQAKESDLHMTNRVNVRRDDKGESECLRVSVEITHPAFALPIYRTWIGNNIVQKLAFFFMFQITTVK